MIKELTEEILISKPTSYGLHVSLNLKAKEKFQKYLE